MFKSMNICYVPIQMANSAKRLSQPRSENVLTAPKTGRNPKPQAPPQKSKYSNVANPEE